MTFVENSASNFQFGLLSPEKLIDWKKKKGILHVPAPPRKVILCPQAALLKGKKPFFGKKEIKGLMGVHLCIDATTGIYLSSGWGVGAAGLISVCEELRVLGVDTFYLIGVAGRLSEEIGECEIGLAKSSIIEEGTSTHYSSTGPESEMTINTSDPVYMHYRDHACKFVTTDAPYRETESKVMKWQNQGATLVDMETSALYSFTRFYKLQALSIAVSADALFDNKWSMVSDTKKLESVQLQVLNTTIDLLKA